MKKTLLLFIALSTLLLSGCKKSNPKDSSTSNSQDEENEKADEVHSAIKNTLDYSGAYDVVTEMISGLEGDYEEKTYDPVNGVFLSIDDQRVELIVPQDNNLCLYYRMYTNDSSTSYYQFASQSYAKTLGGVSLREEEGFNYFLSMFELLFDTSLTIDREKFFATFNAFSLSEEILDGFDTCVDYNTITYSLTYGDGDVKNVLFSLNGKSLSTTGAEYPYIDFTCNYNVTYDERITCCEQTMSVNLYSSSISVASFGMTYRLTFNYEFNQELYDEYLEKAKLVDKEEGVRKNGVSFILNGVDLHQYSSEQFEPNEEITTEKLMDCLDNSYGYTIRNANIDGFYLDPDYQNPFEDGMLSEDYIQRIYVHLSPKEGYTILKEHYYIDEKPGNLPFTEDEFQAYISIDGGQQVISYFYTISIEEDYNVTYHYYSYGDVVKGMKFDGGDYNSNTISRDMLISDSEHVLDFYAESYHGRDGHYKRPSIISDRLIKNDENGILFFGPSNNYELNMKVNTDEYVKDPTFTFRAYQVDHILNKDEDLPENAVELYSDDITFDYYIDGQSVNSIPADYQGEFVVSISNPKSLTFVYILFE